MNQPRIQEFIPRPNPTIEELSKLTQPFSILVNLGGYATERGCVEPVKTFVSLGELVPGVRHTFDSGPVNGYGFDYLTFDRVDPAAVVIVMQLVEENRLPWRKSFGHAWSI